MTIVSILTGKGGATKKHDELPEAEWKEYVRKKWARGHCNFIILMLFVPVGAVVEVRCANLPKITRYRHILDRQTDIPGWTLFYNSGGEEPEEWVGSMRLAGEYDYWRPMGEPIWYATVGTHTIEAT